MTVSERVRQLCEFIIDTIPQMEFSVRDVQQVEPTLLGFPRFDLSPFDYLDFAERSLLTNTPEGRVNCISHLKHAIDCELDTFLRMLGFKKGNIPQQLDLVSKIEIFDSRSLRKLNAIRNKVEHEYLDPRAEDLEVFFNLTQSFIYALDGLLFMIAVSPYLVWGNEKTALAVYMVGSSIEFSIQRNIEEDDPERMVFDAAAPDEFTAVVRVFFLLCKARCLISMEYLVSELRQLIGQTPARSYSRPAFDPPEPSNLEDLLNFSDGTTP